MTVTDLATLQSQAEQIRLETILRANSAQRVGQALRNIVDSVGFPVALSSAADAGVGAGNVAAINAAIVAANAASVALTGPVEVLLPPGRSYIAGTITMLSGVTLRGAGMGKTVLYMPASAYTNTVDDQHDATSVAISVLGGLSSPYTPLQNVTLCDFTLENEVSDGRYLYPVFARNVDGLQILRVEASGIPAGDLISVSTVLRGEIAYCYLHDCTSAVVTSLQTTAIITDDERVNLVASKGLHIHHNRIEDLTMTGAAFGGSNMQTDGITLGQSVDPPRHNHSIHDNYIRNVGEGVDCFASECSIHDNMFVDCANMGVKLIHGARRNHIFGNTIMRPGLAGLYCASSDYLNDGVTGAVEDNYFHDNTIHDVNILNTWSSPVPAGILVNDQGQTYKPNNNTFRGNKITGGAANMDYAIRNEGGTGNRFYDNEAESWALAYSSVSSGSATIVNAKKTFIRVSRGTDQSTASGVAELVEFDSEEVDTQSEFDASTWTYTASSHRRLSVRAAVRVGSLAAGENYYLRVLKNGSARVEAECWTSGAGQQLSVADSFTVVPGDTVAIQILQSEGARDITGGSNRTYLVIEEVAG